MMYIFGVLVNSYSLEHMAKVLVAIKVLVCTPTLTHQVQESYAWLTKEFSKLGGLYLDESEEGVANLSKQCDVEEVPEQTTTSPFLVHFSTHLDETTVDLAKRGLPRNPLYAPDILEMLMQKWIPTAPFWSNLLLGN